MTILKAMKAADARKINESRLHRMLADPYWKGQIKFDGRRFLASMDGSVPGENGGTLRFFGPKLEKTTNVPHLTKLYVPELAGTIFDGEVIAANDNFDYLGSVMGKSVNADAAVRQQQQSGVFMKYCIWDCIAYRGKPILDWPLRKRDEIRAEAIKVLQAKHRGAEFIMSVPYLEGDIMKEFDRLCDMGHEGIMIKNLNGVYIPGKRRNEWFKYKREFKVDDVVIIGFDEPTEYYQGDDSLFDAASGVTYVPMHIWERVPTADKVLGKIKPRKTKYFENNWIGAIRIGQYKDGKLIYVGSVSGIDEPLRAKMSVPENQKNFIGEVIEIKYFERKKSGKFRHLSFVRSRDDKPAEECIWDGSYDR